MNFIPKSEKMKREIVELNAADEIEVRILGKQFIIRGTGNKEAKVAGGIQIMYKDFYKEQEYSDKIYAGTTSGIVVGNSFSIGYEKDIVVNNIPRLDI